MIHKFDLAELARQGREVSATAHLPPTADRAAYMCMRAHVQVDRRKGMCYYVRINNTPRG
ncbi:MAG: hypothetical protein ACREOZ_02095 [Gloeomargaritales cyanobacterium]